MNTPFNKHTYHPSPEPVRKGQEKARNHARVELYKRKKEDLDITTGFYDQDNDPNYRAWLENQTCV